MKELKTNENCLIFSIEVLKLKGEENLVRNIFLSNLNSYIKSKGNDIHSSYIDVKISSPHDFRNQVTLFMIISGMFVL